MKNQVVFEIRRMLRCLWEKAGRKFVAMDYSAAANSPDAGWRLKEQIEMACTGIEEELREENFAFKITGHSVEEDRIWLKGPAKEARSVLAIIRWTFAIDSRDHQDHQFLEIEQKGPGEGGVKIFGTRGPAKSASGPSSAERKPEFDADGVDADSYDPFELADLRDKTPPEVQLEFTDFDMLSDTLELEDPLEMDGDTLGEIMMSVIDKEKLVQDRKGTYDGGYFDNFEGSTVLFHFNTLADAVRVAEHFSRVFTDKKLLRKLLKTHGVSMSRDA